MIGALLGLIMFDLWLSSNLPNQWSAINSTNLPPGVRLCGLPVVTISIVLIVFATFEFGAILRFGGYRPAIGWAAFTNAGLILIPWIQMERKLFGSSQGLHVGQIDESIMTLWLVGSVVGTALTILARKSTERAVVAMASTLLMIAYLGLLGSFFVQIRCLSPGPAGAVLIFFVILTIKTGDIGAYFTGRFIGKHPLAPWLSPKKTIEGFIGAVIFSSALSIVGVWIWRTQWFKLLGPQPFSLAEALLFGVLMSFIGHLGDLMESAIKRDVGIKNSSQIIPGFGGLLDLLDSPLFAAPLAWWLLTILAG